MKKILGLIVTLPMIILTGCATTPQRSDTTYYRNPPGTYSQSTYTQSQPVYTQTQNSTQTDYSKKVITQGVLGAATGAIAAEASGGKAGTGALVGAGTNVLGGALLDMLTAPSSQPQPVQYAPYVQQWNQENPNRDRIVRKYDNAGNIISEEVYTR